MHCRCNRALTSTAVLWPVRRISKGQRYPFMFKAGPWRALAVLLVIGGSPIGAVHATDTSTDPRDVDASLNALFGSHESLKQFLNSVKEDSANKRWPAIAALVAYPIKIRLAGYLLRISNASEFMAHSEELLTPRVLAAIERQTYGSLFANAQGVMIGDGEVWFSAVCRSADCKNAPIKITAINP
jgi:hypothetical protein